MSKEEIMKELTKNAKYDYAWITEVGELIAADTNKFRMEDLPFLETLAVGKIKVMNQHTGIDWFKLFPIVDNLNATQLMIYAVGIEKGVDKEIMSKFTDPKIPYAKSNYIINAIVEDNNTTLTEDKYLSDAYDDEQIYELYAGIKDGVDISKFDDPDLSGMDMRLARTALAVGATVEITDVMTDSGVREKALVIMKPVNKK